MPEQDSKSIPQVLAEFRELVVTYAKQEVVDPLKNLGKFLAWGIAGSVLLAFGGVLLTLAILRFLQTETDGALDGHLLFLPYVITLVVDVGVAVLVGLRIGAKRKEAR